MPIHVPRPLRLVLFCTALVFFTAACGQKGDLYLPDPDSAATPRDNR